MQNIYLTSFDAVQLFTNIPVKDTIDHITNTIPISDIPIDKQTIKTLLEIACTQVPFRFDNEHYVQVEGLSMGSSLAPLMAEFSMDMIEKHISAPRLYIRYVDDCLAIFENEENAKTFLASLNSHHPSIQFTMEKPINGKINFLDMTVCVENGSLSTTWHVKQTNTYLYTHAQAHSPNTYKDNAIRALYRRSQLLTSDTALKEQAKSKVKHIFMCNGYSSRHIDKIFEKVDSQMQTTNTETVEVDKQKIFWKLPFIKSIHTEIKKAFTRLTKCSKKSNSTSHSQHSKHNTCAKTKTLSHRLSPPLSSTNIRVSIATHATSERHAASSKEG